MKLLSVLESQAFKVSLTGYFPGNDASISQLFKISLRIDFSKRFYQACFLLSF